MSHSNLHPNTRQMLGIMNKLDWKKWWQAHPKEDFAQAVKRMSIEDGNAEDNDYPSGAAVSIAIRLAAKYKQVR